MGIEVVGELVPHPDSANTEAAMGFHVDPPSAIPEVEPTLDEPSYEHVPFKVLQSFRARLIEGGRLGPRQVEPFVDDDSDLDDIPCNPVPFKVVGTRMVVYREAERLAPLQIAPFDAEGDEW